MCKSVNTAVKEVPAQYFKTTINKTMTTTIQLITAVIF